MHIVTSDLVEDAPKYFSNDVAADTISKSRYCWYFLFTTNKGKMFLIVFGILLDISSKFDLNTPCVFYF